MPEPVDAWWERRRFSIGHEQPYAPGAFRDAWRSYPVLVRWYHPDLNRGILLSQVPLAADVWLQWQCDAGHLFIATPVEQRFRPGRERRRSSWCPECSALATGRGPVVRSPMPTPASSSPPSASAPASAPAVPRRAAARQRRELCTRTPLLPVGEPFTSACAPGPASAVQADLRAALEQRLEFEPGFTAVRLGRPFFDHREAWPDIVLGELRIAIEYDSTGRHGLEHVGARQVVDERKDRCLRAAGWQVVRIRTGSLPLLGPHDLTASGVSGRLIDRLLDELRAIRGPLLIGAYLPP